MRAIGTTDGRFNRNRTNGISHTPESKTPAPDARWHKDRPRGQRGATTPPVEKPVEVEAPKGKATTPATPATPTA